MKDDEKVFTLKLQIFNLQTFNVLEYLKYNQVMIITH